MALRAASFPLPSASTSAVSPPADSLGCLSCPKGEAGSLRLLESLQQRASFQRVGAPSVGPLGAPQGEKQEGPLISTRPKGGGPPPSSVLGSPRHSRPVVLGPRRKGAPPRSPLHGQAGGPPSVEMSLGAPPGAPPVHCGGPSGSGVSKMNVEIAEVALLVEGGEELAASQHEALTKYVRLMGLASSASFHADLIYAGERLREGCPQGDPLGGSEAGRRAAVVDIIMSYAADLQRCFGTAAGDVARVSIQLAVSILDRSRLVERVKKDADAVRCCAAFCLVMALQHEAPNSIVLERKLKKLLLLEKLVPKTFGVSFGELQRQVLDCLDCRVSVPLPIDFASYLLYDGGALGAPSEAPGGPPPASAAELVCYLLDCFSLTPEAAITPASLAAAAAVELARRIAYADRGAPAGGPPPGGFQGPPPQQEIAGYTKQQLRATLKTIHSFLMTKASKYPGLKRLHEKGWAAVDWQLPQR